MSETKLSLETKLSPKTMLSLETKLSLKKSWVLRLILALRPSFTLRPSMMFLSGRYLPGRGPDGHGAEESEQQPGGGQGPSTGQYQCLIEGGNRNR